MPTDEGKLYLATVLDLGSRRLPGFPIGDHHDAPSAKAALYMATAVRGGEVAGVVFHSDKGSEYTGDVFAQACTALRVTQSMGRVGSALDSAAAESFNSTLEWELLAPRCFAQDTPEAQPVSHSRPVTSQRMRLGSAWRQRFHRPPDDINHIRLERPHEYVVLDQVVGVGQHPKSKPGQPDDRWMVTYPRDS